jgi:hypothetical protein
MRRAICCSGELNGPNRRPSGPNAYGLNSAPQALSQKSDLEGTYPPGSRYHPIPYSLFPIPYSLFPIPYSLFPIPYSLFPIPYSLFPIPYSLFPIPYSLFCFYPVDYSQCPSLEF